MSPGTNVNLSSQALEGAGSIFWSQVCFYGLLFPGMVCQGSLCEDKCTGGDDASFGIAGVNKSRKQGSLHEGHR